MGLMVQYIFLMLRVCAIASFLVLQGSSGQKISPSPTTFSDVPPIIGATGHATNGEQTRSDSPSPTSQPNGFQPPQAIKGLGPSLSPSTPLKHPSNIKDPVLSPETSESPQNPPVTQPPILGSMPPTSHRNNVPDNKAPISPPTVPVQIAPAPWEVLQTPPNMPQVPPSIFPVPVASPPSKLTRTPPPIHPTLPIPPSNLQVPVASPPSNLPRNLQPIHPRLPIPPSNLPVPSASPPSNFPNTSQSIHPILAVPPSNLPEPSVSPVSTPPPSINWKRDGIPVSAPPSGTTIQTEPTYPSPMKSPSMHKAPKHSIHAPPPDSSYESPPATRSHSPASLPPAPFNWHHHAKKKITSPAPSSYLVPPPTEKGSLPLAPLYPPTSESRSKQSHRAPPLPYPGPSVSPFHSSPPTSSSPVSPTPSPSPFVQTTVPFLSPKVSPSRSSPRDPKMPYLPPFQALPPPPPNEDCSSITCMEPLTNPAPGTPCNCVLPMQIGLRLTVALYTFFPLVSELAMEIADGVFMKQSQVRIMGANAASEDPEKTIVLIDLVPLGEKFDNTTAYVTSQRFWQKQVTIKASFFGDYEVLYVRYPGLPPSPPLAPSSIGIIDGEPYYGHGNNGQTIKPLGVDVSRRSDKPNAGIIAIIVLSAFVAAILCFVIAWVLLFKHTDHNSHPEPTRPTTLPSLTKSSAGIAASMIGSGPISASLSFGSSIATYTGSAKTFSASDIERATDNFNDSRVLGEGGFGRVYSGVLEDGSEVAVKVLKRDDQQGGREFLAELEMLSRLHHRNLVRLIGMCTEERIRCIVYELIPNGSVESHLHGIDKESAPLDWGARMKIALGAARGLAYLHEDSSPRVIHRDFKSSNILLENDFTPKVSDFGLARTALDEENRHISTRVMGTFGYVAPEYAMTGHLLVKSDVYSYGVVLLELLTGRKPVDMSQPPGQENLVAWARPLLTTKEGLESIINSSLGPNFPFDSIAKVAAIASMCVQPEVSHRPFMGEVVQALKLVCNECEETKDLGSRSCTSQEDLSIDIDARISTNSGHFQNQSPLSNYEHGLDVERGFPMSDLHGAALATFDRLDSGSYRRRSSSGPLRTGRRLKLWERMKRLSGGGSVSEHGDFSRLWPTSR